MIQNIVNAELVTKGFAGRSVIEDCSFVIERGSIFGLVGKNGAGKTTLIRLLLGLLKPNAGSLTVLGFDPWKHEENYYKSLGVVLEHDGFSGNLTVMENLKLFAAAKGVSWPEAEKFIRDFWPDTFIAQEISGSEKKVKFLSRGQRVQCGICRAFLGWPQVYFFDEPTVALDVQAYEHFKRLVSAARTKSATMLISSHQLSTIEDLCDEVGILDCKQVHDIHGSKSQRMKQQWILIADFSAEFDGIVKQRAGESATYDGGAWHMSVGEPQTTIPELIAKLTAAGCRIFEVKSEKAELKDLIKAHYEGTENSIT